MILWMMLMGLTSFAYGLELSQEVSQKTEIGRTTTDGLVSADDIPQTASVFQYQATLKGKPYERNYFLFDGSLLGLILEDFDGEKNGERVSASKDISDRRKGKVSLNEAYSVYEPSQEWSFLIGRKRLSWGSGYFRNPTDLINPAKNILDPTAARKGAFLASLDYRLESSTATIVTSAATQEKENGIPEKILTIDGAKRQFNGARYWMMLGNYDVSLMRLEDRGFTRSGINDVDTGISFSGLIIDALEIHGEALIKSNTEKDYILGAGYTFSNESTLTVEYLHNDLGLSSDGFSNLVKKLYLAKSMGIITSGNNEENLTGKLLLKDHIAVGLQRYKYNDDIFITTNALFNPLHQGVVLSPSINWMIREWLSLNLTGAYSKSFAGTKIQNGTKVSEQTLFPMPVRTSFEVKAYF
jgi:hypothetical protein